MALLLSLETSTHSFSCALQQDQNLIAFKESREAQTTASMIAVKVDELFNEGGVDRSQLDAVVVACGPGSYTGLRIGVATAKGICYALDAKLISVDTLSLMAKQFIDQISGSRDVNDALFCPMLDARRMEVYCMVIDFERKVIEPIQAKVVDEKSFELLLDRKEIYFFGEGSEKCKKIIRHKNARFVSGIMPSAALLGIIGFQKYLNNEFENPDLFEPFYLKDFLIKKPNLIS
jgi:tRNA threonylcarbamoyladenosine biosynthesis protein TsaB